MISNYPTGPMVPCDSCGAEPARLTAFEFRPDESWLVLTVRLCAVCLKALAQQVSA